MMPTELTETWPLVQVPAWPVGTISLHSETEGSVTVHGVEHACYARDLISLRASLLARCVTVAQTLDRPVRVAVNDGTKNYMLGVRPDGVVQPLQPGGTLAAASELVVMSGPCRACENAVPINLMTCPACETDAPLTSASQRQHPYKPTAMPPTRQVPVAATPDDLDEPLLPPDTSPRQILVQIVGHGSTTVPVPALLGRDPSPQFGHATLALPTSDRTLSRTHALVNINEAGVLTISDCGSANGTSVAGYGSIPQGEPVLLEDNTVVTLGDVQCQIRRL